MKRVISLLLAAVLICLPLSGCKKEAAVPLKLLGGNDLQLLTGGYTLYTAFDQTLENSL